MPNYSSSIIAGLTRPGLSTPGRSAQLRGRDRSGFATQGTFNPSPTLELDAFQGGMQDELRNRAFQAARLGEAQEVGALEGLRKSYAQDQAASPLTQQREQIQDWENFDREAASLGFTAEPMGERTLSPGQARNMYTRQWNEYAAKLPLEQELARGRWEANKANLAARGDLAVEEAKANIEREKLGGYTELAQTLGAGGGMGPDGRQVSSVALPGGFRVGFDTDEPAEGGIPTRLLSQLAFDRYGVTAARNDQEKKAAEGQYIQSQLNALHQARGIDPEIKSWVSDLIVDPGTRDMDFDEIINTYLAQAAAEGDPDVPDDAAFEQARALFRTIRGQ